MCEKCNKIYIAAAVSCVVQYCLQLGGIQTILNSETLLARCEGLPKLRKMNDHKMVEASPQQGVGNCSVAALLSIMPCVFAQAAAEWSFAALGPYPQIPEHTPVHIWS